MQIFYSRNQLVATAGATSALFHLVTQLFPNKCTIYCERTSYMIALDWMKAMDYRIESGIFNLHIGTYVKAPLYSVSGTWGRYSMSPKEHLSTCRLGDVE